MYYRKALRDAGFDPANIKDAEKADEFVLHIGKNELKGSTIGDPIACAGARACKKQQHAKFAWVGASIAILGFPDGKLIRYWHNGQLPKKHDQGMFAIGDYHFRPVSRSQLPGIRKQREDNRRRAGLPYGHEDKGITKSLTFHPEPSLAAQMRRGWEVEMGGEE